MYRKWQRWNKAGLRVVIEGRIQTVTSVTEVLFNICKVEEAHGAGRRGLHDFEEQKQLDMKWVKDEERVIASRTVHLMGNWNDVNFGTSARARKVGL
jgi:hypothetical protein